ncbi:MAG: hypothetical protein KDA91_14475, partial [Planctomycetaceae bacterium]|nr:hypothetical protein [Planctomycetaceae bacterium]
MTNGASQIRLVQKELCWSGWLTGFLLFICTLPAFLPCCMAQDATTGTLPLQNERFIPADQLDVLFERDGGGVLMPRSQFRELLARAKANAAADNQKPPGMMIDQIQVKVTPQDQHAVVIMDAIVRQFVDEWQVVSLPIGNLLVEKFTQGDAPVAEGSESDALEQRKVIVASRDPRDNGRLLLAGSNSGEFRIQITMSTPLVRSGSDRSTAFRLPQLPSTILAVDCPEGQHILVNNQELERPSGDSGNVTYRVPAGGADDVRIQWTTRKRQSESQTLLFVHTDGFLQIQKEAIRWRSESLVSIFGGSINELSVRVPSRLEVTGVESAGLESWRLEDDVDQPGMTRLVLSWRQPFSKDRIIQIHGVAPVTAEKSQAVPTLEFLNVNSHAGRLAVSHEGGLRLTAETGAGIRTTATEHGSQDSGSISVFDFWIQNFDLSVAIKPRDRELFAESVSDLSIQDRILSYSTVMTLETLNAPLFDVRLTLPADWELASLRIADQPADWRVGETDNRVVVSLPETVEAGGLTEITATLTRSIDDPATEQKVELPVVVASDATLAGGTYVVNFANDLAVAPLRLTGLEPASGSAESLSFRNVGTEIAGELTIIRRASQLTSRSVLRTWATARELAIDAQISVDVMNGTVQTLTVRVPESFGDRVHFQVTGTGPIPGYESVPFVHDVNLEEQTPLDVAEGMRPFLLKLSQRFSGSISLLATVRQARELNTSIPAPTIRVDNAVRQHGVLVFEAYPEQQLKVASDVSAINGLFAADAGLAGDPAPGTNRRVALTYRFVKPGYSFSVDEIRFDTESVPSAVITEVRNTCLLNDSETVQRSCLAQFQSSGVQTVRFRLPQSGQSYLWSAMLDGEPIEVRHEDATDQDSNEGESTRTAQYLVAVPSSVRGQDGISRFSLNLVFETVNRTSGLPGQFEQDSVTFSIDVGNSQSADIDVLEQTWNVHYPQSSLLVDSAGLVSPTNGTDQPGWFQNMMNIEFPSRDIVVRRGVSLAVVCLSLFVVTVLVWQRRYLLVSLGGILLVFWLLMPVGLRQVASVDQLAPGVGGYEDFSTADIPLPPPSDVEMSNAYGGMGGMGGGGFGGGGGGGGMGGPGAGGFAGSPGSIGFD